MMTPALRSRLALTLALLVLALMALAPSVRAEPSFPALTGRVVDGAGIIDPAVIASLTEKLAALEAKSTDQLVVVTLPSLEGLDIADYGYQLGRHWGIGQANLSNGVLLIVAPNERKVRIEVGYGLEGTLTDAISSAIYNRAIVPRFKAGDMSGGIVAGVDAIIDVVTSDESEWKQRAATGKPDETGDIVVGLIIMVLMVGFVGFFGYAFFRAMRGYSAGIARDLADDATFSTSTERWTSGRSFPSGSLSSGGVSGSSLSGGGISGGSFSGGGGSFGGGGSSGSW